jgi:hypothetical protein
MRDEHCARFDSDDSFETSNYKITTTPRQEWDIVVNCDVSKADMRAGRRIPNISELMKLQIAMDSKLTDYEVIIVVIYTGPMVSKHSAKISLLLYRKC